MTYLSAIPSDVLEAVGIIGFGLYVLNYTLLTVHKVNSTQLSYFLINLLAATCVLIGLSTAFNLAAALIQIFWIMISITAIILRLAKNRYPTRRAASDAPTVQPISPTGNRIGQPSGAPQRPGQRSPDGSLKTYYPGQESGRRNPPRAMG